MFDICLSEEVVPESDDCRAQPVSSGMAARGIPEYRVVFTPPEP